MLFSGNYRNFFQNLPTIFLFQLADLLYRVSLNPLYCCWPSYFWPRRRTFDTAGEIRNSAWVETNW